MNESTRNRKTPAARIVIVDDHPVFRRGLAHLIGVSENLELCGETGDASSTMALLSSAKPDLFVLDLTLTGGSGLELIKQIRCVNATVKILVCTMHDESIYGERVMRAGANGFLNKEQAPDDIIRAIQHILRGKTFISEELTSRLVQPRVRGEDGDPIGSLQGKLTDRELDIFHLIGEGLSGRKIAEKLSLSPKTVDTHREHIKVKIGAADNAELVQRAVEWSMERKGI